MNTKYFEMMIFLVILLEAVVMILNGIMPAIILFLIAQVELEMLSEEVEEEEVY